jgi:hypothetical protein
MCQNSCRTNILKYHITRNKKALKCETPLVGGVILLIFNNLEPINYPNRLIMHNWQHKNWPEFTFDSSSIDNELMKFMLKAGELKGIISA